MLIRLCQLVLGSSSGDLMYNNGMQTLMIRYVTALQRADCRQQHFLPVTVMHTTKPAAG